MENYQILEAIGEGSFGRVFRGRCLRSRGIVALKFIPKRNKIDRELRSLRRECEIQKELFHPNIVRMVDSFETDQEVVAVSEYVPIQLFSLLEKNGTLTEVHVRKIACNLVSAIYYLHSLRILHRDIKPQNILLTSNGEAKLCDFGFSRKMGINTYVLTSIKGTPLYMAPELIEENPYDHTADLWSLGCILFELLTGKPPFSTTSLVQLIKMVRLEPIRWPAFVSEDCLSFLEGLLQKEPTQRLTWPALLQHPWVSEGVIILNETVDIAPLTCPLSSSQQLIKEEQKQLLLHQGLSQPKVLKNLTRRCFNKHKYLSQYIELSNFMKIQRGATCSLDNAQGQYCFKNDAFRMETIPPTEDTEPNFPKYKLPIVPVETLKDEPFIGIVQSDPQFDTNCDDKVEVLQNSISSLHVATDEDVDVRAAVGSSVRKLSTVSQESGFKEEDLADFRSAGPLPSEYRKDSMVNYLSNSVDSSRRGSRPSFMNVDNAGPSILPNINEESGDTAAYANRNDYFPSLVGSDKPIEGEEWSSFLDKTLKEVMNGNFDIYMEQTELTLFITPLQNASCPLFVTEKILSILIMPMVFIVDKKEFRYVLKVYEQCKIIPNLVYSLKLIMKHGLSNYSSKEEYSKENMKVIRLLLTLINNLLYNSNPFITQFCDAVCILSACDIFGQLIDKNFDMEICEQIIAILNQILRICPENVSVTEEILTSHTRVLSFLSSLVSHKSANVRASVCILLGYIAKLCPNLMSVLESDKKLLQDVHNLELDNVEEVNRSATFVLSYLQSTHSR